MHDAKMRKTNQEFLQFYQLIVLFYSLGKALKKIVAKLSQIVLKHYIVNRLHFKTITDLLVVDAA